MRRRSFVVAIVLAAAAPARADLTVEVGNGDKVTGTLNPATEVETFLVRVPRRAAISVKAKAAKGLTLDVALLDPADAPLANATGAAPQIKGPVAGSSGLFRVTVASHGGVTAGGYSISVSWKSQSTFTATADLAAAATANLEFAADTGAVATLSVKKAKGSAATPSLDELTTPDAAHTPLNGATATRTLAAGDHVLSYRNLGPLQGLVTATVKVKPPKAAKRKIALTSAAIGSGDARGDTAFSAIVGASGGTVTFPALPPSDPGASISGSSVSIPAGALAAGTAIVIATAPLLDTGAVAQAGPPVFFGPEGLTEGRLDSPTCVLGTAGAIVVVDSGNGKIRSRTPVPLQ